jgi:Concanavalin A-like lectin/glucanases superfamily
VMSRRNFVERASAALLSGGALALAFIARARERDDRSYQARVLAKGPVAYWRFDDHGQAARDLTGHDHAGTYHGRIAFDQPGPLRSEPSVGIGLSADAFVEVPDSDAFSQPASSRGLTVEAWLRPDVLTFSGQTAQHYVHWLGKGAHGQFEWGFRFYSKESPRPNRLSAYIWNQAGEPGAHNEGAGAYFEDRLQSAVWIHVVACYDPGDAGTPGAGVSIYKDGAFRAGPSTSRGARYATYDIHPARGGAPLRLGTRDRGSFLTGGLSEVAIYPRVLTAGEIRENYVAAISGSNAMLATPVK